MLTKKYHIEEWREILSQFAKKAKNEIIIDSIRNEPMDINYYVKIKKIIYYD